MNDDEDRIPKSAGEMFDLAAMALIAVVIGGLAGISIIISGVIDWIMGAMTRPADAAQALAAATPCPAPSPPIYASETHKDRNGQEERPHLPAPGRSA